MQTVKMLKTLHGVLAGEVYPRVFKAGEEYQINDSLVLGFMEQGGCELVGIAPVVQPRRVAAGEKLEEGVLPDSATAVPGNPVDLRETKVTGPEGTKPALDSLNQKDLLALCKERGLKPAFGAKKADLVALLSA